jgi:threonylcarbamoyladenosine tRNA methylthiotransferase MtaB
MSTQQVEMAEKRASVRALGCRLNQYEALSMESTLKSNGYEIVPFGEAADIGVINTCTVTNEADAKSRSVIRKFIRENPDAITVVVGCYSQISANEIAMIEGVDYVIGNHDKMNFLHYVGNQKNENPVIVRDRISREDFTIGFVGDTPYQQRANLKIQDGCDFMCTFCVIPFARGRARSRGWANLMEEAESMIQAGVQEIVLTGVNLGTYHSDSRNFLGLVSALSALPGLKRLRISSIEPTTIPEEIFSMMADADHCLMPYLHVPMQSGCDEVLKKMRRKYQLPEMKEFFDRAVAQVPDLCVGTDLLVGFPGESEEEFERTCDTFWQFPFHYCHVFTYSERDGTPAAKIENQVPMSERRRRSGQLRRLSASKRMTFHEAHIGKELRVLIENPKDGKFSGYSDNYVRVVMREGFEKLANRISVVEVVESRPEYVIADWVGFHD